VFDSTRWEVCRRERGNGAFPKAQEEFKDVPGREEKEKMEKAWRASPEN
jgi:hypothetical protein